MNLHSLKRPLLQPLSRRPLFNQLLFNRPLSRLFLAAGLLCIAFTVQAQTDTIWGVNNSGGQYYFGTLFSMNSDGSNVKIAHNFGGVGDGTGLTTTGGSHGDGTIFSYNPATSTYSLLYSFDDTHGNSPNGRLALDSDNGIFYGTTVRGGADGSGVIFSFNPATNTYTDLFEMTANSGGDGYTGMPLTFYNHLLYGMTSSGIDYAAVLFSFNPATNAYAELFHDPNGYNYYTDIALVGYNNVLYGGIQISNGGNIFSFDLSSMTYNTEVTFDASNGWSLYGLALSGSTIYGVTYGGVYPDSYGTIFSYSLPSKYFSQLYKFTPATGYNPSGNPVMANGKLIGLTYSGGASGNGVAYSYDPGAGVYTDLLDFDFTNNGSLPNSSQLLFVHTIGVTPQTISFSDFSSIYGHAPFDPGASASSGLPVAYSSDNPQVAIGAGSQLKIIGVGTANITVTQYGNKTYDSVSVTKMLTVNPAPLVITAVDTFRNQAQPNPVFRASYSGFVNGDSAGSLTILPTLTTTADLASLQGTYPISASGAADPNYTITYQDGTLTVLGLPQQIIFSDSTAIYGGPDTVIASASTGLPVTYASSNPAIVSITADQKIHILSAGTSVITATQAGNVDYEHQSKAITFRVLPAPLSIVADSKTKVYTQPDPVFTATYSGFVNGDDSSSLTTKPVFTLTAGPGAAPGVYLIHVDGAADSNYAISYTAGTYLLTPVEGAQVNSLNTWFSSNTSLQLDIWITASRTAMIQVYDVVGRQLITKEASLIQGNNTLLLPAVGLANGVYIVRVTGDNLKLTQTIRKIN
jgi:uncharacterized repeat protein (TIGR03803 family)